jgi:hypothetical protein
MQPEYRDIGMMEMMSHYEPTWIAVVGILASFATSFALPMVGYALSSFIFVLDLPIDTPENMNEFIR